MSDKDHNPGTKPGTKKPSDMKPCEYLNDRALEGEAINAKCNCPDKDHCPKIRSTKTFSGSSAGRTWTKGKVV